MRLEPCAGLFFIEFLVVLLDFLFPCLERNVLHCLALPSNEESAVEFQSVGLASSSWYLRCELRMIAFTVTSKCCDGKYARKLVFGTLCAWLRSSQAGCEAISFGTSVNNLTAFPYVIIRYVVWRLWNADYET